MSVLVPVDLETFLRALGISPARSSEDEVVALCPGHLARTGSEDHTPSWYINRETGRHYCHSCGYSGSIVNLCSDVLVTSNIFEINAFLREHGASLVDAVERIRTPKARPPAQPIAESQLAVFTHPPQRALKRRQLTADACAHHGVLWSAERKAWVLPIRELDGTLLGWQLKSERIFRNVPRGVKKSVTLFGAHVFGGDTAILVESPLDAVRLTSEGYEGALASYGVTVSETQMKIIRELADKLILALDNDREGKRQMIQLIRTWAPRIPIFVLDYSRAEDCKDPGEMTSTQIRRALDNARFYLRHLHHGMA